MRKKPGSFPEMYGVLAEQMKLIGVQSKPRPIKQLRGRPRKQEHVAVIFSDRLRAGLTEQIWMRERNLIARGWSGPNPPDDRTIRRAIGNLYGQLRWVDGTVTKESATLVLAEIAGQK